MNAAPSRRGLLTGSAATLLSGAAAVMAARAPAVAGVSDTGDAELGRLHRDLVAQGDEVARINAERCGAAITPASKDKERRLTAADNVWWSIVDQITAIPAQGVAGQRAKAATMIAFLDHVVCEGIGDTLTDIAAGDVGQGEHRLALSLARDLLDGRAVA